MEDGQSPSEGYAKPELTKHEDLTQITFSSHERDHPEKPEPPAKTTPPPKPHSPYHALGYNNENTQYEPHKYTLGQIQKLGKRK